MLEANKASASSALTTLIQNTWDNYTYARQDRQDALGQYNKGFAQLQAMAEMGEWLKTLKSTRSNKTASIVTCNSPILHKHWPSKCPRKREVMTLETQQDLRNFDQQKELAKMGYNSQYNLANLGFNQDMAKLRATQAFTAGQNTVAQQKMNWLRQLWHKVFHTKMQKRVMGTMWQQTNVGDYIKSKEWFRDTAYLDSAWVPTIGYGFTSVNGKTSKDGRYYG